jgi:SAM-dependent methyltransferase
MGQRRHMLSSLYNAARRLFYLLFIEPLLRRAKLKVTATVAALRPATLVEVGSGSCTQAIAVARSGVAVTALDISDAMFPRPGARRLPPALRCLEADGRSLPFPNGRFDAALASMTLHAMPLEDRRLVLGEMARVVRPGGTLLIMDFHFEAGEAASFAGVLIDLIERGAGRSHYACFRDFIARGGVPKLAADIGLLEGRRQPILGERGGIFEITVPG